LHDRLALMGAKLLANTIPAYAEGTIQPRKQPSYGVTYARKMTKEDGHLNWTEPARALWNRVRAFTPWPGAFTFLCGETKSPLVKIWEVETVPQVSGPPGEVLQADKNGIIVAAGFEALRLLEVQREGGKRMSVQQFIAGSNLRPGQRFE